MCVCVYYAHKYAVISPIRKKLLVLHIPPVTTPFLCSALWQNSKKLMLIVIPLFLLFPQFHSRFYPPPQPILPPPLQLLQKGCELHFWLHVVKYKSQLWAHLTGLGSVCLSLLLGRHFLWLPGHHTSGFYPPHWHLFHSPLLVPVLLHNWKDRKSVV